jgi:cellulose synthase/poly-beta-1,6-N-acetylglucosamine synthase-like glycosyltransferase
MKATPPPPYVSVIVTVFNDEALIKDCLVSIIEMDYPAERREILVVDYGSTDQTAAIIQSLPVKYLEAGRGGKSRARNVGIESSKGEILAFTDPDCVVGTKWLRELVRPFAEEGVGAVGGEILPYPGTTPAERYAFRRGSHGQKWLMNHPVRPFAHAPNIAFRREVLEQIGLFDPRFPGGGWEDADLCWRFFRETDLELAHAPKAAVFHRYRTTAYDFFVMHMKYGYGLAQLFSKYQTELSWGWPQRFQVYRDLGKSTWNLSTTGISYYLLSREAEKLETAYLDFLRQLGQRVGFLRLGAKRRAGSFQRERQVRV